MHSKPKIVEVELAKIFTGYRERVKVVLLQVATEFAASLLIFPPDETGDQENRRRNDRRDNVNSDLVLERGDHSALHHHKFPAALESVIFSTAMSAGLASA